MPNPTRDGGSTTRAIKNLILERGLRPGDPIPTESELVAEIGVSRSNVREAVRTLVALDILQVRHGTGTFVGGLSLRPLVEGMVFRGVLMPGKNHQALRDVVELRRSLDLALENQIVDALQGDTGEALRTEVDAMIACAERGEPITEHDRRFHLLLAECVHNQFYAQLVAAFWDIHQLVAPQLGLASTSDLNASARAHADLLDAALAGDADRYREAIAAHYQPILRTIQARSQA